MRFSDKMGITKIDTTLQTESMSEPLRNSLWNVLDIWIWKRKNFLRIELLMSVEDGDIVNFSRNLWAYYFKKPMDTIPDYPEEILSEIRDYFFKVKWYEVYDFMQFVLETEKSTFITKSTNKILKREFSGYRFIENSLVSVTDEVEIKSLEETLNSAPFTGASKHLKKAMKHMSDIKNPDYSNSIKESISAVESMAREITGKPKATLGDTLTELEKKHSLHGALKKGFSAIYGYASDEGGIRHAMSDEPKVDADDAKYFLVSCAAFVNYLKSKILK